jgi:hypothetical protein
VDLQSALMLRQAIVERQARQVAEFQTVRPMPAPDEVIEGQIVMTKQWDLSKIKMIKAPIRPSRQEGPRPCRSAARRARSLGLRQSGRAAGHDHRKRDERAEQLRLRVETKRIEHSRREQPDLRAGRGLARSPPSPVRARISLGSNSASPPSSDCAESWWPPIPPQAYRASTSSSPLFA